MTTLDVAARPGSRVPPALFAATTFASAVLVFLVQPMVAKLVLPLLGGSPSVWNTSMAFFQIALLAGYAYAHLLQRLASARRQALVHLATARTNQPIHHRHEVFDGETREEVQLSAVQAALQMLRDRLA